MEILNYKYLVGIDFGDGETTASFAKIMDNGEIGDAKSLQIFKGGVKDKFKAESSVYIDKSGKYNIATRTDHWTYYPYEQNFKLRPDHYLDPKNDAKLTAFKEFVTLVFKNLLEYNKDKLEYNPQTGKKNFFLCVACPSKWVPKDDDIKHVQAYETMLKNLIPIDVIIKESDAAFFHFIHDNRLPNTSENILVIDYGSSTIDYTYYNQDPSNRFLDCDGSRETLFGAQKVEQAIYDYIKKNSISYSYATNYIKDNNLNPDNKILLNNRHKKILKDEKEHFYGVDATEYRIEDYVVNSFNCTPPRECLFFFRETYTKDEIENTILQPYKELIKKEFHRIADKENWIPEVIMITGGASRMGWVEDAVKDIFSVKNPNIHVISDTETASYVVSHGIVKYLTAYYRYCLKLRNVAEDFKKDYLYESKLESAICLATRKAISSYYSNEINNACHEYIEDDNNTTLNDLVERIDKVYRNLGVLLGADKIRHINKEITKGLNEYFTELVETKIHDAFKESFLIDMDIQFQFPHYEYWSTSISITGTSRNTVIRFAGPCVKKWIFDGVDPEKPRDALMRKIIANSIMSAYSTLDSVPDVAEEPLKEFYLVVKDSVDTYFSRLSNQLPLRLYSQL